MTRSSASNRLGVALFKFNPAQSQKFDVVIPIPYTDFVFKLLLGKLESARRIGG
jgi:hypothetical protein